MRPPFIVGTVAAVFCAAAAAVAAAAVTIDPPSGWKALDTSSMSVKYEAAWAQPAATDNFAQNITLLKQDLPGTSFDDYAKLNEQQLHQMDAKMTLTTDAREACGTAQMLHLKYATTIGTNNVAIEQLLVQDGATFYVGTYARLVKQPELPEATQALKTMCAHVGTPAAQ